MLVVVGLVVLLAPTGWRTVQIANVIPGAPVHSLDRPGDRICTGLSEVPAAAGFAEFSVQGTGSIQGRLSVLRGTKAWTSPDQRVAATDGVARFRLPDGSRSGDPSFVCLEVTARSPTPIVALGTGEVSALRLVGTAPQSRLAQLPAMLGRVDAGTGTPLNLLQGWLLLAVGVAVFGGALVVVVRAWSGDRRPGRRTWVAIAVIGVLHAWAWAAMVPGFQVPDENSHFHYATYVADHHRLPEGTLAEGRAGSLSQQILEQQLQTMTLNFRVTMRPPWAASDQRALREALKAGALDVPDVHTNATGQPPLYYLSVAPATIGSATALDQLARMRLLSGLWMAIAVLGAIALVRALSPARPRWAVTAGLAVALFPLLGFVAGGVNPDVAMTALAFWTFAAAVRCWRDGLRPGNAVLFALAAVLLSLTKLTGLAIVPGAALIVLAAVVRDLRAGHARAVGRTIAWAVAAAAVPIAIYVLITVLSGRPVVPGVIGAAASETTGGAPGAPAAGHLSTLFNNVWQLFLPRMPGSADVFAGTPLWTIWADGLAGRLGYVDYGYTEPVRRLIVSGWVAVVAAAGVGAFRLLRSAGWRSTLRRFGPVLVGSTVAIVLLLTVIGIMDYNSRSVNGPPFQQARYLLPGLPVVVLAIPLGLRAFGRRTQPFVGVLLVGAMVLWAVSAWGLTLVRYAG